MYSDAVLVDENAYELPMPKELQARSVSWAGLQTKGLSCMADADKRSPSRDGHATLYPVLHPSHGDEEGGLPLFSHSAFGFFCMHACILFIACLPSCLPELQLC